MENFETKEQCRIHDSWYCECRKPEPKGLEPVQILPFRESEYPSRWWYAIGPFVGAIWLVFSGMYTQFEEAGFSHQRDLQKYNTQIANFQRQADNERRKADEAMKKLALSLAPAEHKHCSEREER